MQKKLTFLIFTIFVNSCNANLYQSIAKENLKSLTQIEVEEKQDTLNSLMRAEKEWHEVLQESLKKQLNPAEDIKRRAVFKLFSKYEEENPFNVSDVLDEKTWQDLEILSGPKSDPAIYLASKIDRTCTQVGKATLFRKIVQPQSNLQELEKQQKIVKELVENEQLFNQIDERLKKLETPENAILSFWTEDLLESGVQQGQIQIPFRKKVKRIKKFQNWLNKNEYILEVNDKLSLINKILQPIFIFAGTTSLALYNISPLIKNDFLINFLNRPGLEKLRKTTGAIAMFSLSGLTFLLLECFAANKEAHWIQSGKNTFGGINNAWHLYYSKNRLKTSAIYNKCLQEKLIHVATYLDSLKDMAQLVEQNPVIAELIPEAKNLNESLEAAKQKSKDFKHLISLLQTKTFKGEPSIKSLTGRIFVAYKLMMELKEQFVDMFLVIGQIDANMSIAKLYKEFENKKVKYCFPKYINHGTQKPCIKTEGFWNPVLNPERVVANSLTSGNTYNLPQGTIITGPNAGGKSTILKAFVINIILAQSIGIAPASKLEFTPFDKIMTYLNITDDIAAGNSHFKAGVVRARELINVVEKLEEKQFALTALDEVFNGTTFKEGQAAAYSLIKFLGTQDNNACVTCTHFPIIPSLEQETGLFANYKVTIEYDQNGKIQCLYKLIPGISDQVVTFKILEEEGFSDKFLTRAQTVLNAS